MQKTLTPRHPSENDCFADDAVEDAEESDITLSPASIGGRPLCNLRFADKIKILVNIFKPIPYAKHMDEWEHAGRSGPLQILKDPHKPNTEHQSKKIRLA